VTMIAPLELSYERSPRLEPEGGAVTS